MISMTPDEEPTKCSKGYFMCRSDCMSECQDPTRNSKFNITNSFYGKLDSRNYNIQDNMLELVRFFS